MTDNLIHLADIPVHGPGAGIWSRLHEEREAICETLVSPMPGQDDHAVQDRMIKIDKALDRLMSGSYGSCSQCGRPISKATLDFDPVWSECLSCWAKAAGQPQRHVETNSTHKQFESNWVRSTR